MPTPDDSLQQLAQRAETAVAATEQAASEALASQAGAGRAGAKHRQAVLAVLVVACIASVALQWRAMREPFPSAAPGESAAVVQSDLQAVATFVDAFRLAQGRYPDSLDEVRLPDALARLVSEHRIGYERTAQAYTLRWTLPPQQAIFDGASGQVRTVSTGTP